MMMTLSGIEQRPLARSPRSYIAEMAAGATRCFAPELFSCLNNNSTNKLAYLLSKMYLLTSIFIIKFC